MFEETKNDGNGMLAKTAIGIIELSMTIDNTIQLSTIEILTGKAFDGEHIVGIFDFGARAAMDALTKAASGDASAREEYLKARDDFAKHVVEHFAGKEDKPEE